MTSQSRKEYMREYNKKYREKNKERINELYREWRAKNKDKWRAIVKKSKNKNKEKTLISQREYRSKNKDKIRAYYLENQDKIKDKRRKYYINNKYRHQEYARKNKERSNKILRIRYQNDDLYRINKCIRSRIFSFVRSSGIKRKSYILDVLGCTWGELWDHLESKFLPGMTRKNHGEWHIDHKIPISIAKNEEDMKRLCHYTNLQPLWAHDNLTKHAKIINE